MPIARRPGRAPLTVSSLLTVGVTGVLAMSMGCASKGDGETQTPGAEDPAALVTPNLPAYEPVVPYGPRAGSFPTSVPAYAHEKNVIAHAIVHDVRGMLAGVRGAVPPMFAGMVTEEGLRAMASESAPPEGQEAVARLRFDLPLACVAVHAPAVGERRRAKAEKEEVEEAKFMEDQAVAMRMTATGESEEEAKKAVAAELAGMNASGTGAEEEDDGITKAMERAFESLTFACAVPFEGGVAAVAVLVPPEEVSEDAEGHALVVTLDEDTDAFLDDLGDYVVWSVDDEAFGLASSHLERVLADAAGAGAGARPQLELSAFAPSVWTSFPYLLEALVDEEEAEQEAKREKVEESLDKLAEKSGRSSTQAMAALESDVEEFMKLGQGGDPRAQFESLGQLTLTAGVQRWGVHLGAAATASSQDADNALVAFAASSVGGVVDPALAQRVPATSFAVANAFRVPDYEDEKSGQAVELLCKLWAVGVAQAEAELAGETSSEGSEEPLDPAACASELLAWGAETRKVSTGHGSMFALPSKGSLLGLGSISTLRTSGRAAWQARMAGLRLESLVGGTTAAKIREYVTFSFETDARSVAGVPVDRGSMTLTTKSVEAIEAAVREEADSKAAAAENLGALRALFGSSWSVQWAEVDNVAVSTFAFQDTDAVMDQALAAVRGEGALAADPGLASAADHHRNAHAASHINPAGVMGWLRGVVSRIPGDDGGELLNMIPADVPGDLSTIGFYGEARPSGHVGGQVVVGADFIVDMVFRIMAASGDKSSEPEQAAVPVANEIY